ncbi:hypothetical protein DM02DRAFT_701400, partial [Periconia macrospinosa]
HHTRATKFQPTHPFINFKISKTFSHLPITNQSKLILSSRTSLNSKMRVSTLIATGSALFLGSFTNALPNPQHLIVAKQCGELTIRNPSGSIGSDALIPTKGCFDYTNRKDGAVIIGMVNNYCYCGFVAEPNCGNGSPNGATLTHMNWPESYPLKLKDTRSYSCVEIPGMGPGMGDVADGVAEVQALAKTE